MDTVFSWVKDRLESKKLSLLSVWALLIQLCNKHYATSYQIDWVFSNNTFTIKVHEHDDKTTWFLNREAIRAYLNTSLQDTWYKIIIDKIRVVSM